MLLGNSDIETNAILLVNFLQCSQKGNCQQRMDDKGMLALIVAAQRLMNNIKPLRNGRDTLPRLATYVRDTYLDSGIEKDLYENWLLGGGGYSLSYSDTQQLLSYATNQFDPKQNEQGRNVVTFADGSKGVKQQINFYRLPKYDFALGAATVFFRNGKAVGISDEYDFDFHYFQGRNWLSDFKTGATNLTSIDGLTKSFMT